MNEGEDAEEEEGKEKQSTWPGEISSSKESHRRGRWRGVVDLPNLGAQHVVILTESCFHYWGIFGMGIFTTTDHPAAEKPKSILSVSLYSINCLA